MRNRYIDHSGYIDVRALALDKRSLARQWEEPADVQRGFNYDFSLYLIGCASIIAALAYWM